MVRRAWLMLMASLLVCGATVASATSSSASQGGAWWARSPPAGADQPARLARLTLPAPTGPHPVGTVALHLIDRHRANPWTTTPPYRELMISVWYPAREVDRYPLAPQMPPGAAAHFGSAAGHGFSGSSLYGIPADKVDFAATRTSGHQGAPVARLGHPLPVVLYSPGRQSRSVGPGSSRPSRVPGGPSRPSLRG